MQPDLLERCRAGDLESFRALVLHWGDNALALAVAVSPERARAERAVRDAFLTAWRELPLLHTERPFRPWLMSIVAEAAHGNADDPLVAALADARGGERAGAAALRESKAIDAADDAVRALVERSGSVTLPQTFVDEALLPRLTRTAAMQVSRVIDISSDVVSAILADPSSVAKWTSAEDIITSGPLEVGARIRNRGKIADRRASRDSSVITRSEPSTFTWTTRARPVRLSGVIEFRWSIDTEPGDGGTLLVHRLHGVAFPAGVTGLTLRRAFEKFADGMQLSMHRGLERLTALVHSAR